MSKAVWPLAGKSGVGGVGKVGADVIGVGAVVGAGVTGVGELTCGALCAVASFSINP